ncbi:unnamed protein product [Aureobasidium uvarum]|uniref:Uncharacterized protein n=1 Tax=Aureobasidium uvarum TaxID=2773716 RepID=A0A9N8PQD6_9PEZI|nr:unnamed protein product [Aureobasidium uvarum]
MAPSELFFENYANTISSSHSMFKLQGKSSLKDLPEERKREYVAMATEGTTPPENECTPWYGHPITMNVKPDLKMPFSSLCYADLSRPMAISLHEYLEQDLGSLDGDEYFRLLSLFKLKIDSWISKSFDMFETGTSYDQTKLVLPYAMPLPREAFDDFAEWKRKWQTKSSRDRFIQRQQTTDNTKM